MKLTETQIGILNQHTEMIIQKREELKREQLALDISVFMALGRRVKKYKFENNEIVVLEEIEETKP